jgi:hypothetical protein
MSLRWGAPYFAALYLVRIRRAGAASWVVHCTQHGQVDMFARRADAKACRLRHKLAHAGLDPDHWP